MHEEAQVVEQAVDLTTPNISDSTPDISADTPNIAVAIDAESGEQAATDAADGVEA